MSFHCPELPRVTTRRGPTIASGVSRVDDFRHPHRITSYNVCYTELLRTVTVFSGNVEQVRSAMAGLSEVGRQGVVLASGFQGATEYLFTRLNEVKPEMVEEASYNFV